MKPPLYLIAGLGKTGLSIARHLQQNNKKFIAFDSRPEAPQHAEFIAQFPDVQVYIQHIPEGLFSQVTDVVVSPGLSLETPCLQQALEVGLPVYGDIECLAQVLRAPVIAITGTNGKSTVTTLVGEMAKAAGYKVAVAGNIGHPVLDIASDGHQYDLWVLELSSFQLDLTYSLRPIAATILNISPDHLDRHHTMSAYIGAKQRIYHQAQVAVFNRDDLHTVPEASRNFLSFGQGEPEAGNWGLVKKNGQIYLAKGTTCFLAAESVLIKGVHNWLNALAACALAEQAGIPESFMIQTLRTFSGLPHRCQWVRTLDGIDWINDSKGTNIGATISAINGIGRSMQGQIVLIAGGQGKGADFTELVQPIADFVRSIVLIGEDADKIEAALGSVIPITRASSLNHAVTLAKSQARPGDVVLLSPACASLDMFHDFNHRGDVFTSLVRGL
jgi:UDP-N-acetylmuramoylalanine--D-glutamate ligase